MTILTFGAEKIAAKRIKISYDSYKSGQSSYEQDTNKNKAISFYIAQILTCGIDATYPVLGKINICNRFL